MGLRQNFRFSYTDSAAVENWIEGFANDFRVEKRSTGLFVISRESPQAFQFDAVLNRDGLVTDRSGLYFEFVGIFLERLTASFGLVEIEDC